MVRSVRDRGRRLPGFPGAGALGTRVQPPPVAAAEPAGRGVRARLRPGPLLAGAAVFSLALLIDAYRRTLSPDLHIDEFIYASVSQHVAGGQSLSVQGMQFFWQPPLFFLVVAPLIKLFGLGQTGNVDLVLQLRIVNAVIGALTAVGVLALGWRLRGAWTGLAMALLFVTDPFVIRVTRRLYLEPFAAMWVLLALWFVYASLGRWTWRRRLLAGALFGGALLSKELVFFSLAIPVVLWLRREVSWKEPLTITLTAVAVYAVYPLWAVGVGEGGSFLTLKLFQYNRLVGVFRYTGFNRQGVSFTGALIQNASDYWTSYLIIGLGAPATAWLWFRRDRVSRFLAAWAGVTYAYFAALAKFGTLNDQFFYYLMLPVVAVIGYTFALNLPLLVTGFREVLREPHVDPRRLLRQINVSLVAMVLAVVVLAPNAQIWVRRFAVEHDDGVPVLQTQIDTNVPLGSVVAAPGFAYQELKYLYPNGEYELTSERDPLTLATRGVHWFVMATKDISIANGMTQPYFDAITSRAVPVWRIWEHTQFQMGLFYVADPSTLASITVPAPPDPETPGPTIAAS